MRKLNSLKNFITTIFPYVIITVLGFWKVRAFISNLGDELYSINQVFFQILTYLSLAEAGIGIIANQKYFKLFVENDRDGINRVYTASKKFLKKVGIVIILIGFVISFGLKIVTNNSLSLIYLQIVFMIFLLKNSIDYFMCAPRNVIQSDQKSYKINTLVNLVRILESGIEIALLYLKVDYLIILIPGIFVRIIINFIINKKIFKEYPWLKEVENEDKSIFVNSKHYIIYRISTIVYNNIDILIISSFLDPAFVVMYSGYNYIVKTIADVLGMVSQAIGASLGNAINELKSDDNKVIFEKLNCAHAAFSMFCTICFTVLIDKFITIWIGEDKQISIIGVILFSISLFILIYSKNFIGVVEVKGWFKQIRNIAIAESIVNLVLSLILVHFLGITGVLLATVIATLTTSFIMYPTYVYKNQYNESSKKYYIHFTIDIIYTAIISAVGLFIIKNITISNFFIWVLAAIICAIISAILIFIEQYITSKNFKLLLEDVKSLLNNKFQEEK